MTKTEKLMDKINENGIDVYLLAEVLEISYLELLQKINGESEFLVSEIYTVAKMLNLSSYELEDIFLRKL